MKNPCVLTLKRITFVLVCVLLASGLVYAVSAQGNTVVKATASTNQPNVGDTLTVKLTVSDVQNLGGVDVMLSWNSSVLKLSNVDLSLGVESHPDGVLHGSKLNYDLDSVVSGEIYVKEENLLGDYELVAQTIGQGTSSFTGSGTIATLTFNVTNSGPTGLNLETELSDFPAAGQNANLINHTDTADSVDAVPEYPSLILIAIFMVLVTAALVITKKHK